MSLRDGILWIGRLPPMKLIGHSQIFNAVGAFTNWSRKTSMVFTSWPDIPATQ